MYLEIEFEEQDNSFDLEFEQVTEISDGGFDRGYAEGYENGKGDGLTEGYAKGETEGYGKGYEQGNTDGYTTGKTEGVTEGFADALAKRTELVVTENGDYAPQGDSTGFKTVSVNVESDIDALIDGSMTEVNSGAASVRNYAFYENRTLTSANFPNATSVGREVFYYCVKLTSANISSAMTVDVNVFQTCRKLISVDISAATKINNFAFSGCNSLKSVILRSETVCTLVNTNVFTNCYHILGTVNSTYNPTGAKDGYIYVPSHLVESYQSATNWSIFSTQFRALEDYTVDGTITGALDPNKI